jgi:pyruvate ferredoxin oxidoreductase gamma subunit
VSDEPIYEVGEITFPDIITIFHPQVMTHGKSYTMPFYFGIKDNGIIIVNSKETIPLPAGQEAELKAKKVHFYYFSATQMALDVAGTDLATNMAIVGAISAITRLTTFEALEEAVKERFLGKGFVVSGGTASLDSVVEKKFAKKTELIAKNTAVIKAAWEYADSHGWSQKVGQEKPGKEVHHQGVGGAAN